MLEHSDFNIAKKSLITYSKLGLIIFKVRVRFNNIFKVRINCFQKLGLGVIAYSRLGLLQS